MTDTINFIFNQILPALWAVMISNVFTAWAIALTAIAAIVSIYKNTKT